MNLLGFLTRDQPPARDAALELAFLSRAERNADVQVGWLERVLARLAWAQGQHGDSWTRKSLDELLDEMRAEAEDLGGWPVLTLQRARQHPDQHGLNPADLQDFERALAAIAEHGAELDELIYRAREIIELARLPSIPF